MRKRKIAIQCLILAAAIFFAVFIGTSDGARHVPGEYFSAMWVATVSGLDFSGADKSAFEMRRDIEDIVQTAYECGFDAIYFQVRPAGDAFYDSDIFPRSKWLGDGSFDPLLYLCREAEYKGIEVHAWINPYRLTVSEADSSVIANKFPHLVMEASDGKKYLNPGNPESIRLVTDGVRELLENYSLAGVVFDDYFYPANVSFDDSAEFKKFGGGQSLENWRRQNTYDLIKAVNDTVHEFECMRFGVSPSGVWQNKSADENGSDTKGMQSYSALFADTRKWVKDGILDYIAPQIYWEHGHSLCDFETVARWWAETADGTDVDLYISHAIYKVEDWGKQEIARQLSTIIDIGGISGSTFYRYQNIKDDVGSVNKILKDFLKG